MTLPADVAGLLAPLRANRRAAAVLSDFDGTLSPIVDDPSSARPLDGAPAVLATLAAAYRLVAVISGRPAAFLLEHLSPAATGLQLYGLYGLEQVADDGSIVVDASAEAFRPKVEDAAGRAAAFNLPGVTVERKGLAVVLHWRTTPAAGPDATALAHALAAETGLAAYPGRQSIELRPRVAIDKGSTMARLLDGIQAGCFLGDDIGDLPAFSALRRPGFYGVGLVVASPETPPELRAAADAVVDGPAGVLEVLRWLAAEPG